MTERFLDTILLVEDNLDDQELTARAMRQHNIANPLVAVSDGVQALDYLFRRGRFTEPGSSPPPRVVLLDLKLPKVSGLEVLEAIRADSRTRLLPVVVLTSSAEEADIVRSYGLGANSYVRKPLEFQEFAQAVRSLGLFWLILNEPPPRTL